MLALGDYFISKLTRRVGTTAALLIVQVLSLAPWLIFLAATPIHPTTTPALRWLLAATAACHALGLVFVYRAFEVGALSIVPPISAGFAVVTAILALGTGERLPAMAVIGACLLVGGTSAAYATVVTALASLFSVLTVLLAWIFLRERLAAHQWTGVAIILGGILLVSL